MMQNFKTKNVIIEKIGYNNNINNKTKIIYKFFLNQFNLHP